MTFVHIVKSIRDRPLQNGILNNFKDEAGAQYETSAE
jgi:hypothetical protein